MIEPAPCWSIFSATVLSAWVIWRRSCTSCPTSGMVSLEKAWTPGRASLSVALSVSALVTTGYHAGGVAGGVVASLWLHRAGWYSVAAFAGGAALTMLALALLPVGGAATVILIACAGFFVTGIQNGVNGAASALYPPESRATGLGWALGIARIGAIMGPMIGSLAAIAGLDQGGHFFLIPAGTLAIVLVLASLIARRAVHQSRPA
eukprot:gene39378-53234_t